MKIIEKLFCVIIVILLASCNTTISRKTETYTIHVIEGKKLIAISWNVNAVGMLTRPMSPLDTAETYYFNQNSSVRKLKGTVMVVESKQ